MAREGARRDVLVLCYHGVPERARGPRDVEPAVLASQIRLLLARGYAATTFERAVLEPPSQRTLAITFDDGERSVVDQAFAVLSAYDVPATVFVPTETVRLPHVVSWEELRELSGHGWEVGSHGKSHRALPPLPDTELERELDGSRRHIEDALQRPCRSLAYPYGLADARCVEAARRAGYVAACLLGEFRGNHSPLTWPRVGIGRADGAVRFRIKVSRLGRRVRGSWLGPALAESVHRLGRG